MEFVRAEGKICARTCHGLARVIVASPAKARYTPRVMPRDCDDVSVILPIFVEHPDLRNKRRFIFRRRRSTRALDKMRT